MAELEIHQEGLESDEFGKRVGALAAIIAIFLAGVTISSHRAHTAAVVEKTEANDQWSFFQSKRTRLHNYELGKDLILLTAPKNEEAEKTLAKYEMEIKRYEKETEKIQKQAEEANAESKVSEKRALRFDLGEGFLELGLVLSSLYFLSKKKFFPVIGGSLAILGIVLGAWGYML